MEGLSSVKFVVALIGLLTCMFLWGEARHAHDDHSIAASGPLGSRPVAHQALGQPSIGGIDKLAGDAGNAAASNAHDPTDHTHFPDEDRAHTKSVHSISVDFAHCSQSSPSIATREPSKHWFIWQISESTLCVRPPIRPPMI